MPVLKTVFFPWIEVARAIIRPLFSKGDVPPHRILIPLTLVIGAAWFVTVPIHELLHVAGCLLSGGEVTELTIQPIYGGTFLSRIFSFVTPGGDYAGQLKGFDTGGSDFCYFITVCFPFLLTVFFGIPLLVIATRSGNPIWHGVGTVQTILPIASVTGDYYELGSIVATRLLGLPTVSREAGLIRGDDLSLVFSRVREADLANGMWIVAFGVVLGILFIAVTFDLSILFARLSADARKLLEK